MNSGIGIGCRVLAVGFLDDPADRDSFGAYPSVPVGWLVDSSIGRCRPPLLASYLPFHYFADGAQPNYSHISHIQASHTRFARYFFSPLQTRQGHILSMVVSDRLRLHLRVSPLPRPLVALVADLIR